MKRYLVFFGNNYYPSGGINDLIGRTDTLEEAISLLNERILKDYDPIYAAFSKEEFIIYEWGMHWANIYDTKEGDKIKYPFND